MGAGRQLCKADFMGLSLAPSSSETGWSVAAQDVRPVAHPRSHGVGHVRQICIRSPSPPRKRGSWVSGGQQPVAS